MSAPPRLELPQRLREAAAELVALHRDLPLRERLRTGLAQGLRAVAGVTLGYFGARWLGLGAGRGPSRPNPKGRSCARPVLRHRSGVDHQSTPSLFLAPNARRSGAACSGSDGTPHCRWAAASPTSR